MIFINNRVKKICAYCGKEFTTKFPDKIYCKIEHEEKAAERRKSRHPPFNQLMCEARVCGMSFKRYTAALRAGKNFEELRRIYNESKNGSDFTE